MPSMVASVGPPALTSIRIRRGFSSSLTYSWKVSAVLKFLPLATPLMNSWDLAKVRLKTATGKPLRSMFSAMFRPITSSPMTPKACPAMRCSFPKRLHGMHAAEARGWCMRLRGSPGSARAARDPKRALCPFAANVQSAGAPRGRNNIPRLSGPATNAPDAPSRARPGAPLALRPFDTGPCRRRHKPANGGERQGKPARFRHVAFAEVNGPAFDPEFVREFTPRQVRDDKLARVARPANVVRGQHEALVVGNLPLGTSLRNPVAFRDSLATQVNVIGN